mmetsp:Transcript_47683/g.102123  ORF Transcript_47683/g.102123 Transcript_47683/m.102123 type:complete len:1070 (+) Transcript_47683:107-3316(+)
MLSLCMPEMRQRKVTRTPGSPSSSSLHSWVLLDESGTEEKGQKEEKEVKSETSWKLEPFRQDLVVVPSSSGDEPDEELRCAVCLNWPKDPMVLGCPSEHMICRRCLSGNLCPLDHQPFAHIRPPQRAVLTMLGRVNVRCPDADSGCDWIGQKAHLEEHRGSCLQALHRCERCNALLRKSDGEMFAEHHQECQEPSSLISKSCTSDDELHHDDGLNNKKSCSRTADGRREAVERIISAYEQAEKINVCFLVDCTGSMGPHIRAVKEHIRFIVYRMRASLPSAQLYLSFVGYRDHCDQVQSEVLPFTNSVPDFEKFVESVRASGGGDTAEDVHGGVEEATKLDWNTNDAATRVLIHIADAPGHGSKYHNLSPGSDNYHAQGDPKGRNLEELVGKLKDNGVQYIFGHIQSNTEKMVRVLNETFPDYIQSKEMKNTSLVAEVVAASLHSSVSNTVSTLTSNMEASPDIILSSESPDWETITMDLVTLRQCRPVPDVAALYPGADAKLTREFDESTVRVAVAPLPFARGETRATRHARREDGSAVVVKHFMVPLEDEEEDEDGHHACVAAAPTASPVFGANAFESLFTLSEVSAIASFLADEFSKTREAKDKIRFLSSAAAWGAEVMPFNLEDALPTGEFRRFSNNVGCWEPDAPKTLMEFSRFTHEVTKGHLMVVDLQGVFSAEEGWILTDPCILSEDLTRFGSGNMGPHALDRSLASLKVLLDEEPVHIPAPAAAAVSMYTRDPSLGLPWGSYKPPPRAVATPWRPPHTPALKPEDRELRLDDMISLLLAPRHSGRKNFKHVILEEAQITALIEVARDTFMRQPTLLELEAPIKVLGDIHGQFYDLLEFFAIGGTPPETNYLLLGDYVDRGKHSIEVISLLLAFKVKYPENFFLLRGNHECASVNRIYGFYDECKRRYNVKFWKRFVDLFNSLPPAALIDSCILCMHGGISPELENFDAIRDLARPTDVPDTGLLCDLLWSDPCSDGSGWIEPDRGVSVMFGADIVEKFCEVMKVDLIVRAHQVVEDGYEFFAGRRLVTIFSAPKYCGEFDNVGALLEIGEDLSCSFKIHRS